MLRSRIGKQLAILMMLGFIYLILGGSIAYAQNQSSGLGIPDSLEARNRQAIQHQAEIESSALEDSTAPIEPSAVSLEPLEPIPMMVESNISNDDSDDLSWLHDVKVGYDGGFVIASQRSIDLGAKDYPFRLKMNGWGQLRHAAQEPGRNGPGRNEFQLARARLVFAGTAFQPNFQYFVQLDGRSSSGDSIRLLDYYLSYDVGRDKLGLDKGVFGFRTGRWKMPFAMARYLSGREFEFTDRSVSSMFFDVNRSVGWSIYGNSQRFTRPFNWELAIFNGLVTGGAETGSAGSLDKNFAFSGRVFWYPTGEWGKGELADFDWHDELATRVGAGFANSTIDRIGNTEFTRVRVVDSGATLSSILPPGTQSYNVGLYAVDFSSKYRGYSFSTEYYFRQIGDFQGTAVPSLFDHGFWMQIGKFVVPGSVELLARWSRVVGESGTLGASIQSSDEVAGGFAWYFRDQSAKLVIDATHLDGAPINSAALGISPGDSGWLFRTQIQFAF